MTISKEILAQKPEELISWLNAVKSGAIKLEASPNDLLGVADGAVFEARHGALSKTDRIEWAEAAVAVYEFLADKVPSGTNSFDCSGKMFTVSMIEEFGPVEGHSLLDPRLVEEWFFQRLNASREEILEKAQTLRNTPVNKWAVEKIIPLRELKSRLNVIEQLKRIGCLSNPELDKWLEIKKILP